MISKVSGKIEWLDNSTGFQRNSIGKSAMSSFEVAIAKQAESMRAMGMSDTDIASKFNISVEILANILTPVTKVACACENSKEDTETYEKLSVAKANDDALKAYNELHGIQEKEPEIALPRSKNPILSAAGGRTDVTDIGGPSKQIKSQTSNSIWDAEVLERNSKVKGNDEILKEAKISKEERKAELKSERYQTIDGKSLEAYLKEAGTVKGNSVNIAATSPANEPHKYSQKLPSNSISIFESGDYERLPEKTAGENLGSKQKVKDRSWLNNNKSLTSKDIFNSMIDSFTEKE